MHRGKMEPFSFGVYNFIIIWGYALLPSNAQLQNMVCEKPSSRNGRQMIEPGPECDFSHRNFCTVKTDNYPEEMLLEIILDNRGIMKKLFGDHREARFLQQEFSNNIYDEPARPPPPLKSGRTKKPTIHKDAHEGIINGRFPGSDILANSRHGKKIDDSGPKVIKYGLYLDDVKKSKHHDDVDKTKAKPSTNDLTSRPNDKLFDSVDIVQATVSTTQKPDTTEPELNETIMTTVDLRDETTTIDEFSSLESPTTEAGIFTDRGTPPQSGDVKEGAHDLTTNKNNSSKNTDNLSETSTVSLDFGDEVTYDSKLLSPNSIKNVLRSDLVDEPPPQETTTATNTTQPTNLLKGRVEFKPSFPSSSLSISQQSQHVRPEPSGQQFRWTTPTNDEIATPSTPLREHQTEFPLWGTNSNAATKPASNLPAEKFSACNSTSEFIAPTWAKNIYGKNLIVINVGSFIQELHIQECEKDVLYRKMFCRRGCRCEQQYRYQKLLVIDPDDECRGIFSDWFRFPSCCVCVCYQRPSVANRNARYMHEMDYDDEDYEDYLEDDLDDPSVRFYYGLDLTDKERVWEDLEPAASDQRVYTSFTDIHSIDRSLNVETPYQEGYSKNKNLSAGLNSSGKSSKLPPFKEVRESYSNSSLDAAAKDKKSRLLKGFGRTVNVRPQIPPRRIPPPRAVASYPFPWIHSPALSIWPSIAMYKQFSSYKPSGASSRSLFGGHLRYATPAPFGVRESTVGTLDAATPPYFSWGRKPTLTQNAVQRNGSSALNRIPRSVRNRGN